MKRFLLSHGSHRLSVRFVFSYICLAFVISFITYASLVRPVVTFTDEASPDVAVYTPVPAMSRRSMNGNRAYMEYSLEHLNDKGKQVNTYNSYTCGILRQQVMYVYATPDEVICLGSDILSSHIGTDELYHDEETGADIVVIAPNGDMEVFDTTAEKGYIGSCAQEQAGANYMGLNPVGYTPHYYYPKEVGTYEIRFHSYSGTRSVHPSKDIPHVPSKASNDPTPLSVDNDNWKNTGCTVGAYDITVVEKATKTVKTGRTYTYYLSLNMGDNSTAGKDVHFTDKYYVVTTDGYIYEADFDLDPFGFLFFANNRGVSDTRGSSVYRSYKSGDNNLNIASDYKVYLHNPSMSDTAFYKSYRIFTERPADDLIGTEIPIAYEPETISDVKFVGARGENITYKDYGGYFTFTVKNAVSVSITIDFSCYNEKHGTSYEGITLKSGVEPGENRVFWNGRDGADTIVDTGVYSDSDVKISVNAYVGEVHFPLLDVENCYSFMINRVNDVYDIETGERIDTENNEAYDSSIYYDNSTYTDPANNKYYHDVVAEGYANILADGENCSNGTKIPLRFTDHYVYHYTDSNGDPATASRYHGDFTTIDLWKYFYKSTGVNLTTAKDIVIIDLDEYDAARISAYVFYDSDKNGKFETNTNDYGLEGVRVTMDYHYYESRWTLVTDDEGNITRFDPMPCVRNTANEDGSVTTTVLGYYHDYRVVPYTDDKGKTKYAIYKWDKNDRLHNGEPVLMNNDVIFERVEKAAVTALLLAAEDADENTEPVYDYVAVIPVHMETLTDSTGYYSFEDVLFSRVPTRMASWYVANMPPHNKEKTSSKYNSLDVRYKNLVISVKNPDPALYGDPTTSGKQYQPNKGDAKEINFAVTGADNTTGDHNISLASVDREVYYEKQAAGYEEGGIVSLKTANVGYYCELYDPPLTVQKQWSDDSENSDITSMDITIGAFDANGNPLSAGYQSTVTVTDLGGWKKTLTTLPALPEGCVYKTVSESFTHKGYEFTYYSDGTYSWTGPASDSPAAEYPFNTTFAPIDKNNTEDRLVIHNNSKGTTSLNIIKTNKRDEAERLALAYFKLYRLAGNSWSLYSVGGKACTGVTDENGTLSFHGIVPGSYRLEEATAPDGFKRIEDIEFTVSTSGSITGGQLTGSFAMEYTANIADYPEDYDYNGKIEITKVNEDGNALKGAEFAVYNAAIFKGQSYYTASKLGDSDETCYILPDENGNAALYRENADDLIGEYTVDENGRLTAIIAGHTYIAEPAAKKSTNDEGSVLFEDLKLGENGLGEFRIREIKAPAGYLAIAGDIPVTAAEDITVKPAAVIDPFITFDMELVKTNIRSERLSGAKFVLYYEAGGRRSYFSKDSGTWVESLNEEDMAFVVREAETITGMVYDRRYYLGEIEAPDGFKRLTEPVIITIDPEGIGKCTAKYGDQTFPITLDKADYKLTVRNEYLFHAGLKKTVMDDELMIYGESNSAEMGQLCNYRLEVSFDRTDRTVKLMDILPAGFVLEQESLKIMLSGTETELDPGNYTVSFNENGCSFVIDLTGDYLSTIPAKELTRLDVYYSALITKAASCDEAGNVNTAILRTDKEKEDMISRTTTYIYDLTVYKYTYSTGSEEPLAGAHFVIMNEDGQYGVFKQRITDGVYLLDGWTDDEEAAIHLISPENGYIRAVGLDSREYTLCEIEAPEGYYPAEDIMLEIGEEAILCKQGEREETVRNRTVRVENHKTVILPMTGGNGTTGIYTAGLVLILVGIAGVIIKTRKRE